MMIGELHRSFPTVHVPPWPSPDDPTADVQSGFTVAASVSDANAITGENCSPRTVLDVLSAFRRYLPSNECSDVVSDSEVSDSPVDVFSGDTFRMFEFKVRRCARGRSHDWTECPYAHPGEKARRRDPRKFHYSGTACPEFRKGSCRKGDSCEFAHGVFECWLHPARYRTQPCKDGTGCRRRVCFFAHTPEQLRVLPQQSPRSAKSLPFLSSPSPPVTPVAESPPLSPVAKSLGLSLGSNSIAEMVTSLRNLQLGKVKSLPASWNIQVGSPVIGSPKASVVRPGFFSVPATPTPGIGYLDFWDRSFEEEPAMERVESGRDLRAKMFEKLSRENCLDCVEGSQSAGAPDVEWVSELIK